MARASKRSRLVLTAKEKSRLDQLRLSKTAAFRDVQRAQILWRYDAGETVSQIARALKMTRKSVLKWIDKALRMGVEVGMKDTPHKPQFGMLVGLLTVAPYATLDRPRITDLRYWIRSSVAPGLALGGVLYFVGGRSTAALIHASFAALVCFAGFWLGLMFGNNVNRWIVALKPTFQLMRRIGRTLMAFAFGYLAIVTIFATLFAAVWRLAGPDSFSGLPAGPTMPTFVYFSLVTATTVGYGDIVPKSPLARSLAGLESIVSLAWTLVVFAALSVRFGAGAVRSQPPSRDPRE